MGRKQSPRLTHPIALARDGGRCTARVTPGGKLCRRMDNVAVVKIFPDKPDYVANLVTRCPKHRTKKLD